MVILAVQTIDAVLLGDKACTNGIFAADDPVRVEGVELAWMDAAVFCKLYLAPHRQDWLVHEPGWVCLILILGA